MRALEAVIGELNAESVRFLVAGGLAVAAHGYLRFTADLDLAISLDAANVTQAFRALERQGYRPTVSVTAAQFADPNLRSRGIEGKGECRS